ncbi:MAG TPA: L,D-transpeptidase family protein, partial [Allosphingosinicella sp.]|nr:L,D-transpeptidase family protein [Allosphingosinicella sp.]
MKRLLVICGTIALMLGSARPPAMARSEAPVPVPAHLPKRAVADPAPTAPPARPQPQPQPVTTAAQPAAGPAQTGGGVRVLVSLPQQRLWVFRGRELIATSAVSTGKRGHETPAGTFPILQKRVVHHSSLYDNAPMPYMQRLTNGGVALHGGRVPGYRASHGCIRL